ncbi:MAG: flavodoxin domain-containing protein [Tissierellia bacterium]|nr:flavodoxin domain-containing protein [Tissierellia bacterium]
MKAQIVYGSHYGSAKAYAQALAASLRIECLDYRDLPPQTKTDLLLYVGSLYAGGMVGLAKSLRAYDPQKVKGLFIISVGLADPQDRKNLEKIKRDIQGQVPPAWREKMTLFHLRGRIDYKSLNIKHQVMMKVLYHRLKTKAPQELKEEDRALLKTYGQTLDYMDLASLDPVLKGYRALVDQLEGLS